MNRLQDLQAFGSGTHGGGGGGTAGEQARDSPGSVPPGAVHVDGGLEEDSPHHPQRPEEGEAVILGRLELFKEADRFSCALGVSVIVKEYQLITREWCLTGIFSS